MRGPSQGASSSHGMNPTSLRPTKGISIASGIALFVLLALVAIACSSKNAASELEPEEACHQNSDCASGLLCALGACRVMCASAADCPEGGSCVDTGRVAVC